MAPPETASQGIGVAVEGEGDPVTILDQRARACWSADSRELILSVARPPGDAEKPEIWRVSANGSNKKQVSIPDAQVVWDWSADGRWLLVPSSRKLPEN